MKFLLDTNICVYIIRQKPAKVFRRFRKLSIGQVGISTITYCELSFGVQKSQQVSRNEAALELFIGPLEIVPYPKEAALTYGRIRAQLEKSGQTIGPLDTLIAAHALYADVTLVTNNLREFSRIPNLKVENWV